MKKLLFTILSMFCLVSLTACPAMMEPAWSDGNQDPYYQGSPQNDALFRAEELEDLVAPIALYPDPLIAQILPAATFVDQIEEATHYIREHGRYAQIDQRNWDVSVKAIAHYPDLLDMMNRERNWTVALGQAFINQQNDVMYAIQVLRQNARAAGNLVSTPQQQVVVEDGYIRIIPSAAEVIYVPSYDTRAVYIERPSPGYGLITFGAGLGIGAWLNRDCDWRGRKIYYHGWRGRGWVTRSRPHAHVQNNIYINEKNRVISTNQAVARHDSRRYRERIRDDAQRQRDRREQANKGRYIPPPREKSQKLQGRPVAPITGVQPQQATPRRDQRPPDTSRPSGIKPAPTGNEQLRVPAPGHDRDRRIKDWSRNERQGQAGERQPVRIPSVQQKTDSKPEKQIPGTDIFPSGDTKRVRDIPNVQPVQRPGFGGHQDTSRDRERIKIRRENAGQPAGAAPVIQHTAPPQPLPAQKITPHPQRPAPFSVKENTPQQVQQPSNRPAQGDNRGDREQRRQRDH